MSPERISAVLVSQEHHYKGTILTAGQRLLEILNDVLSDYLHLYDAQIYRATAPDVCVATFPVVTLRKAGINLVMVSSERHEAPEKRRYSYVQKKLYAAFLTVPGYEIRGKLHINFSPEPVAVLTRDTRGFFPVTEATISEAGGTVPSVDVSVVMVQKSAVSLFYVGEIG